MIHKLVLFQEMDAARGGRCEYEEGYYFTPERHRTILATAKKIEKIVMPYRRNEIVVVSSPNEGAVESAKVIDVILGTSFRQVGLLKYPEYITGLCYWHTEKVLIAIADIDRLLGYDLIRGFLMGLLGDLPDEIPKGEAIVVSLARNKGLLETTWPEGPSCERIWFPD